MTNLDVDDIKQFIYNNPETIEIIKKYVNCRKCEEPNTRRAVWCDICLKYICHKCSYMNYPDYNKYYVCECGFKNICNPCSKIHSKCPSCNSTIDATLF